MKVKYKTNLKGLNELMKSPEMQNALTEAGNAVQRSAGDGYEVETETLNFIAITRVKAETTKAVRDCHKNNTLLTALGSVGLRMKKG